MNTKAIANAKEYFLRFGGVMSAESLRNVKFSFGLTDTDITEWEALQPLAPTNGHSTEAEIAAVRNEPVKEAPKTVAKTDEPVNQPIPETAAVASENKAFIDQLPEVPASMKLARQWVRWNLETRHGKPTKVPYQLNGAGAASDKPEQWTDYESVCKAGAIDNTQGPGFMFANGFAGIDLDGCRNAETGDITPWAENIVDKLDGAYVEISPSGTGLHIFVRGVVPGADKKFNLNPAIGYGKAAIEIYDTRRYFTVTGEPYFEDAGDIHDCDLKAVYSIFHQLRNDNPAPRNERAEAYDANGSESTKIELLGTFSTTKYDIFKNGEIESENPFVISNRLGRLTYPSPSEADLGFCTVLAFIHGDNPDAIWDEYTKSALVRDKWLGRKESFHTHTIAKAIATAARVKANETPTLLAPEVSASRAPVAITESINDDEGGIPPFDPSVVNGIYKKFVDVVTHGTTLVPQFAYTIVKTIVGARMAGKVKFQDLDVEPRFYAALIGESGSGKGEAWRRVFQILNCSNQIGSTSGLKIINSADSGAGIRDVFFEAPEDAPVLLYLDEVTSFGNKAAETRNPALMDMLIELADSTSISRTKAKKKGDSFSGSKTKNDARLCAVMCGQEGPVYMKAFAGRTKLGLWDRLYPEYSVPVDAGDLPPIPAGVAFELAAELNKLDYSGLMTKSVEAKTRLESFWAAQSPAVRKKARWKKNLSLDAFMSAFGRGSKVVELEDAEIAIKIFTRQLLIRRVHFTSEVPDRTGYYLGLAKRITDAMRRQLKAGMPPEQVAKSRRDYEKETNAQRDNEEHLFDKAWQIHSRVHLSLVKIQKANGHVYDKFLPIPDEE